ncbi:MAG: hypothetical protein CMA72_07590, partial [Euryarchaeota archaeon]|nr:hypothetical protein [Euryarchaeota archaeon]
MRRSNCCNLPTITAIISGVPNTHEFYINFNFTPLYKRLNRLSSDIAHHSPITEWNFYGKDITIEGVINVRIFNKPGFVYMHSLYNLNAIFRNDQTNILFVVMVIHG